MSAPREAIEKLQKSGTISLFDLKVLKLKEQEALFEEIKYWCLYGNGKPEKLGKNIKSISSKCRLKRHINLGWFGYLNAFAVDCARVDRNKPYA